MTSHSPFTGREIRLAARPVGEPAPADFALAEAPVPRPGDGQILVRNTWMSVDPYMRGRMDDVPSPVLPPFELGVPLEGAAVGEVIASRSADVPVGATVSHFLGWREYAVLDAAAATVVDTALAPVQAYLGPLGTTGLTAYASLTDVAPVREGDVVFISAAAGAVGSVAGQLARRLGAATVIGSAGGPEKTEKLLADFGFDTALDHRAGRIAAQLADAAPDGIDVYLDAVGGDHLEAAIDALNVGGRAALVGAISGYNATAPVPGPANLAQIVYKRLALRGMQVGAYLHLFPEYIAKAAGWLADGTLHTEETVFDGLDRAPAALLGNLRGANTGKTLVRL
ncbi:NADP-dependent oxidoreductase [Actinomadura sp. WMMB 499]|uniref:NADP-dependent oxidoreductase n=1 Tax=Actinomadura sp. WMMB 499 TaxID=1219491 RepID=UPI001246C48B|nr:NADP-dependent oxidoreductase [Actinomadura sp. WMMB 499]QFG22197.1 NADP-dependent oxidoreductase [Actinomadura sp. WMMB 499]